jgi:hypothetical protein
MTEHAALDDVQSEDQRTRRLRRRERVARSSYERVRGCVDTVAMVDLGYA